MAQESNAERRDRSLIPFDQFKDAFQKVLKVTKKESDEQLARFQAENKAKRKPKT